MSHSELYKIGRGAYVSVHQNSKRSFRWELMALGRRGNPELRRMFIHGKASSLEGAVSAAIIRLKQFQGV